SHWWATTTSPPTSATPIPTGATRSTSPNPSAPPSTASRRWASRTPSACSRRRRTASRGGTTAWARSGATTACASTMCCSRQRWPRRAPPASSTRRRASSNGHRTTRRCSSIWRCEPMRDDAALHALYPVFDALPASLVADTLAAAQWIDVPDGAVLFDEHQPCEGFPFVLDGAIRVTKHAPNGRELPLYRVTAGETCILSSSCLLGHTPYNARGVSEGPVRLMALPATRFDA